MKLTSGRKAPEFTLPDQNGDKHKLSSYKGQWVLVYFYPKDDTPGCTKQACAYRDAVKAMKRKDVEIVGVSGDSAENHQHFKNEYQLNFTLLADTDGKIADAFGVMDSVSLPTLRNRSLAQAVESVLDSV